MKLSHILVAASLILLFLPLIHAETFYNVALTSSSTSSGGYGIQFVMNTTAYVNFNVTRYSGVTANTAYLVNATSGSIINTSTSLSGDTFQFGNLTMYAGQTYGVVLCSGGSSYSFRYKSPQTFPIVTTNGSIALNYTGGFSANSGCASGGWSVEPSTTQNVGSVSLGIIPQATNFTITARDAYTASNLFNLTAVVNGVTYSTTTGIITTPLMTNHTSLVNISLNASDNGGYITQSYNNRNISTSLTGNLAQSAITFYAREKISGNALTGANFTTIYLTNVTHYARAGTYLVNASASGYFTKSQNVTIAALSIATVTIENMTNARLNLTAKNNMTNVPITSFTADIVALSYSNYSWSESISGGSQIELVNGTYQVTVRAPGYAPQTKNITVLGSLTTTNSSFELYAENSVLLNVYNASSLVRINTTTITVQAFGPMTYINSTTNGTLFIHNLTPGVYNMTISAAAGFESAQYIVTIGNNSFQYLDAYLESTTTNSVVFTALDDDTSQAIPGVLTAIEKRVNGTYYLINSIYTDITGRFEMAYASGEVYRFTMSKTGYATKQFELSPIIFTSYNVRLTRDDSASLNVSFAGVSVQIEPSEYVNNVTHNFSLTIASPLGQLQLINYTIIRSNNATLIQNSSANAYGATLTSIVPIHDAVIGDTVTLNYGYIDNYATYHAFTVVYTIAVAQTNSTRFNTMGDNRFGLPLFDRFIIVFLVTAVIAGAGFLLEGPTTAGFLAILTFAYFGSTGFVSWWLMLPSIIILCLLGVWKLR